MANYSTIAAADTYFDDERIGDVTAWTDASDADKTKALVHATRLIDNLSFVGKKAVAGQALQFPREYQSAVPEDVNRAVWECALALLEGVDMEVELEGIHITRESIGDGSTTYDRTATPVHLQAGLPSGQAWRFINRYVKSSKSVSLHRV